MFTGENIKLKNDAERQKAIAALEKAKKLNPPERIIPAGMYGEDYQKFRELYVMKKHKGKKKAV